MEIGILLSRIGRELVFWMAWIIIPLLVEIIPAIGGFFIVVNKKIRELFGKKKAEIKYLPGITVIIPVYNSAKTLGECLKSIYNSDYPVTLIDVLCINNESTDNSFEVYSRCQSEFRDMAMAWLNSGQGKAKALNMALFNSQGKYIIHIDSDGKLHYQALKNIVRRFELEKDVDCLTGTVLTDMKAIEDTDGFMLRLLRRCEFYEYCQSFLAGRNFESELDNIYTVAGAFSAFRKSAILKSQLYNTLTVSEDTQVTFQMRRLFDKGIKLCENAFFFVDPIDNGSKLYTQRQRWQRGEIEVSHMFLQGSLHVVKDFFRNFMIRVLLYDHTFAFPRMIWYFAIIFLIFRNYPMSLVIGSIIVIYLLYVVSAFLFFINVWMYLAGVTDVRKYYRSKWYLVFLLPIYNFMVFWIRFAGIINSIKDEGKWKTATPPEEWSGFKNTLRRDFRALIRVKGIIRKRVNNG
ncbi:putative glycosyltransferase, exosortase G system-associated [Bacillota bacterium]